MSIGFIQKTKICPHCSSRIRDNASFCTHCGRFIAHPNKPICTQCGKQAEERSDLFCEDCGTSLTKPMLVQRIDVSSFSRQSLRPVRLRPF